MFSRRNLLRLGAAAGASALVAPPLHAASQESAIPPSIAALTSLKSQARPITADERRERIERARQLMQENKLDAIFLTGGTSLVYFTGIRWWLSERLFALVLPAKAAPFFVCPAFEVDRAHEQIARGPLPDAEVRTWEEDEDPYERLVQGLRDRGLGGGRIGIEETVRFVFSDGLSYYDATHIRGLHGFAIDRAKAVTAGCRMIKSAHELELMTLANHVTLTAYAAAWKALRDGMTQNEFESLIAQAHQKLGFSGGASVQVNEYSALPHGSLTPQVIREGSIILIDGGCSVEGYQSDMSRTFVLGKPTDKMKRNFDIVHRAQQAALAAAKPGAPAESVDAAARKFIADAGYGPDYKSFTHRLGHGIGMDGHEWPYLVRGNKLALAPGMSFSDEPGIYIRGEFGVRLEDDMHITPDGAQLFTPQSPSLEQPFAT